MVSDSGRAMYRPPTAKTARAAGQAGWAGVSGLSGGLAARLAETWVMRGLATGYSSPANVILSDPAADIIQAP